MLKHYRIIMLALVAMLCGSAFAEDIIWSEDWSGVTEFKVDPTNINPNYTFTGTTFNEDNSYKSGTTVYNENLAGGVAPELLIAKNGGTFAAKIALNGKTGDMMLSFKCNKKIDVTVEGATIGDPSNTGYDYIYPVTVPVGTSEITITFTQSGSSNSRLDNIKLYQGTAKLPAGLSWGTSSRTVTIGAEDNLFPTLSNENNLTVDFSSSEESVATIDADGNITLVAAGTTVISAIFDGDNSYEAQTVSYTLTVKDDSGTPVTTDDVTVAQALTIIDGLAEGGKTDKDYIVKGYIVDEPEFGRKTDDGSLFGTVTFKMADTKGDATNTITVFRAKSYENQNFTEETISLLNTGDLVEVQGKLQKYKDKENNITPEVSNGFVVSINGNDTPTPIVTVPAPVFSIAGGSVEAGTTVELSVEGTPDISYVIFYTTDGSVPSISNGIEYSGPIEITEAVTIKAITAEVTGATSSVVEATFTVKAAKPEGVVFLETFDGTTGTGGNDDAFTGSIATNDLICDEEWEEPAGCGGANKCLKFGTSKAAGTFTTSSIALTGNGTLTFRAAGWGDAKENTLTVTATGAELNGDTEIVLTNGEWTDYEVGIVGAEGDVVLSFTGARGFIDDITVTEAGDIFEKVDIPESGYTTFVSEFNVAAPDDAEIYIVVKATKLGAVIQQVNEVPARTPVIIKGDEGIVELPIISATEPILNNLLMMAQPGTAQTDPYVLDSKDKGIGFYRWTDGELPYGTIFLNIEDAEDCDFVCFGEATAIAGIKEASHATESIYDLSGRQVVSGKLQRGLYILNGKKVVLK